MTRRKTYVLAGALLLAAIVAAGFIVPALSRAIESGPGPPRGRCLMNVRQIGLSMIQYASDHDGEYPPSFGVLVKRGYLTTSKIFICPSSDDRIPEEFSYDAPYASDRARTLDLDALNRVEEFGSYVMVKGLKHVGREDIIVVYEKAGNHREAGRNCFFDDGHAKWLPEDGFQEHMKAQKAKFRDMDRKDGQNTARD